MRASKKVTENACYKELCMDFKNFRGQSKLPLQFQFSTTLSKFICAKEKGENPAVWQFSTSLTWQVEGLVEENLASQETARGSQERTGKALEGEQAEEVAAMRKSPLSSKAPRRRQSKMAGASWTKVIESGTQFMPP